MAEWNLTPEYIVNNWTDEELDLMTSKLSERKQAIAQAATGATQGDIEPSRPQAQESNQVVTDTELFRQLGRKFEVKGRGH